VLDEGYVDCAPTPLFAFGHGLSYTTFAYSDLRVHAGTTREPVEIECVVTNSGHVRGEEVVQLYVSDEVAAVARPDQMLVGFARVSLDPGSARRILFTVDSSRLAYYDPDMQFVTEPGSFSVQVGASSSDIRLSGSFDLTGETVCLRQRDVITTSVSQEDAVSNRAP
jgi:beta-glucosidase